MDILQVRLFSRVQISHNNWKTEVNTTRVIQALLAYLLLQRNRMHSKDRLAALLWGEQNQEKARSCLNTALWRLRCILEPEGVPRGTYLISNHFGEVGFNQNSQYWLDVASFQEHIMRTLTTPHELVEASEVQRLEGVIHLYKGELLEGFYDDWALREREHLRTLYLNSLAYLMRYKKHHKLYEQGLAHGQQILDVDPLREEIHREMMRLYMDNGQRALAIRQYKTCSEILKTELNIQSMAETQALYAQILLSGELSRSEDAKGEPAHLQETLESLRLAARSVQQVHAKLTQAIESIEMLVEEQRGKPLVS